MAARFSRKALFPVESSSRSVEFSRVTTFADCSRPMTRISRRCCWCTGWVRTEEIAARTNTRLKACMVRSVKGNILLCCSWSGVESKTTTGVEEKGGEASAFEKEQRKPLGNRPGTKKKRTRVKERNGGGTCPGAGHDLLIQSPNCLSFFQPSNHPSNKAIRLLAPWQCYVSPSTGLVSLAETFHKRRTGPQTKAYGNMSLERTKTRRHRASNVKGMSWMGLSFVLC